VSVLVKQANEELASAAEIPRAHELLALSMLVHDIVAVNNEEWAVCRGIWLEEGGKRGECFLAAFLNLTAEFFLRRHVCGGLAPDEVVLAARASSLLRVELLLLALAHELHLLRDGELSTLSYDPRWLLRCLHCFLGYSPGALPCSAMCAVSKGAEAKRTSLVIPMERTAE
jgi:hypothetical protein